MGTAAGHKLTAYATFFIHRLMLDGTLFPNFATGQKICSGLH